jgi:hypothetical protein
MKTKIALWTGISVLVAGIVIAGFFWLGRPQVITLTDGTKLTLLGVTYGRHHVAPKMKIAGRSVRRGGTRLDTTNDTLVIWIEAAHKPNRWPNYELLVYDPADTACVSTWARTQSQVNSSVNLQGFMLEAYPRWDRKMILRAMTWGNGGQRVSQGRFVVSNPARRGPFPRWTPEPLPDAQSDGDLDVTLTELVAGAPSPYNRGNRSSRNDPMNKGVQVAFDVQQNGLSATNWRPVQVVTSDAAGNRVSGWINDYRPNGERAGYFYQAGLWPEERAWKLRVEFSRTSGFNAGEIWTVADVPVRAGTQQEVWNDWGNSRGTRAAFAETTLTGIHVKLFPAIQFSDQNQNGQRNVSFLLKTDPDAQAQGMRLTLLKVTDDQNRRLENRSSSWGGGSYQYQFPEARNTETLNITLALHKSRFVEFTVKPAKP